MKFPTWLIREPTGLYTLLLQKKRTFWRHLNNKPVISPSNNSPFELNAHAQREREKKEKSLLPTLPFTEFNESEECRLVFFFPFSFFLGGILVMSIRAD